ncbi:hypothetical protein [Sphingorhabdus sp. 109]|jgi:hypothetical protein|uniref:hypothetical protein n=1 Tax=Sphingorhabdus sp. 109 TaxID=2653173 RepID=UPI0012F3B040|nr:hypothetical protein [Sphingorhabdus sp. 109]VWX60613.1 conserved exported hypothetical protein [Sphingorhabdus sp. 109]
MKKSVLFAAAALAAMASGTANAAPTDGVLSDTASTGTLDVNVTVVPMVSIRGLDDVSLTIDAATIASNFGSTSGISQFCVFSNADAAGSYKVTVNGNAGDGLGNPYGLNGAATGTQLNHTVGYYDAAAYNSIAADFMRPGLQFSMENTRDGQARATDLDCTNAGGQNSSLRVTVRNSEALAALADTYTGTLSVVVAVP